MKQSWPVFLQDEGLFTNAVRLRSLIWTIQDYVPPGSDIVEVGFGSGTTAVLLADLGYHVTAVDIDQTLVDRLSQGYADWVRQGQLSVLPADMLTLPWPHRNFALAYHQGVLEHFSDDQIVQTLREQARVAEWVIFDVPNYRQRAKPFGDERLLAPAYWRSLIYAAGLELVRERGRDFPPYVYVLPGVCFTRRFLTQFEWFGRMLATNSIFVCRARGME